MKQSRGLFHISFQQRPHSFAATGFALAPHQFSVAPVAPAGRTSGRLYTADRRLRDNIWLSPSLAAGAIAARVVCFFETRVQMRTRRARGTRRAVS